MPKVTFYNLKEEKKQKIENAIEKELKRNFFEKVSISSIIVDADIPRGSFYQYFEDKDDALMYVIQKYINSSKKQIEQILIQNNGDIFKTTIDLYTKFIDRDCDESEIKLFQNIVNKLRNENISIFKNIHPKQEYQIYSNIDTKVLNIENEEDLDAIIRILSCVLRDKLIRVMRKKVSKEEGKKELVNEIEILKNGMTK